MTSPTTTYQDQVQRQHNEMVDRLSPLLRVARAPARAACVSGVLPLISLPLELALKVLRNLHSCDFLLLELVDRTTFLFMNVLVYPQLAQDSNYVGFFLKEAVILLTSPDQFIHPLEQLTANGMITAVASSASLRGLVARPQNTGIASQSTPSTMATVIKMDAATVSLMVFALAARHSLRTWLMNCREPAMRCSLKEKCNGRTQSARGRKRQKLGEGSREKDKEKEGSKSCYGESISTKLLRMLPDIAITVDGFLMRGRPSLQQLLT